MADSSESTAPADETPQPAANDPRDEQTARILEYAAFMDEEDHPSVLTEIIALLIQEIHELRPGLAHSTEWFPSEIAELDSISEARWRGATLRSIEEIGVKRSLQIIDRARSYRSQLAHRTDEGESHD